MGQERRSGEQNEFSRAEVIQKLYESTKVSLDALYKQARTELERQLGNEPKPRSPMHFALTPQEKESIQANEEEPFSSIFTYEVFTHKPTPRRKLEILLQGYFQQWFFMRPKDMKTPEKRKFIRLIKAFPEFQDIYLVKEAFRSGLTDDCKTKDDILLLSELAKTCISGEHTRGDLSEFLGWLQTVSVIP